MIRASRSEAGLLVVLDLTLVGVAFVIGYVLRFALQVGEVTVVSQAPSPARYAQALAVVLIVFHLVLRSRGLYARIPPRGIDVVEQTLQAVTLAALIVLAATFFFREFTYSRSVTLLGWAFTVGSLSCSRILLQRWRRSRWRRGEGLVPALVVGAGPRATDLIQRLARREHFGVEVRGVVLGGDADAVEVAGVPVRGALDGLEAAVEASGAREVLITDTLGRLELLEALETCERLRLPARVVPTVYDLFITAADLSELHGVPFVSLGERRFERPSLWLKRGFDLLVATALLLPAAPLLLLLTWRIRRESPGPAFFVQQRVGEGGRVFSMWKLRTMVADAEARLSELVDVEQLAQPVFKLEDDPRVTPLGRRLRRWSLDELPQLWNVVRGDMSLVGPRPEEEGVVRLYDAHHRRRLKARPGLTGLQQIEARAVTDLDERVRLDVYYLRRRTFLFDLWILLRTPRAVLRGEGAV